MHEVTWHEKAPLGKMDLVVDLNFRMDTSALYSDIVLPAATWYEKADLNSTDMHSFIHPAFGRGAAVLGVEKRLADFPGDSHKVLRAGASAFSRTGPRPGCLSALHDTPARSRSRDAGLERRRGRARYPDRTMPNLPGGHTRLQKPLQPVHRIWPLCSREGLGAHGYALRRRRPR